MSSVSQSFNMCPSVIDLLHWPEDHWKQSASNQVLVKEDG